MNKLLPLLFVILMACQAGKETKSEVETLKAEVMAVHDEVMPKMGELRNIRKALLLQADSLIAVDSARASLLKESAEEIAAANESMMNWMRAYNPDFEGTEEETKAYLSAEKESVTQVKKAMEGSLDAGIELLNSEE